MKTVMKTCLEYGTCLSMENCPIYKSLRRILDAHFSGEDDRAVDATRDMPNKYRMDMRVYTNIQNTPDGPERGLAILSGIKDSRDCGGCMIEVSTDGEFKDLNGELKKARDEEFKRLSGQASGF